MSRFGETRWLLEAACWLVAVAYMAATAVCGVGYFARHAAWVYTSSFVAAGAVGVSFVVTALVLAVTVRGGGLRPTRRLRTVATLWWENASSGEKVAVVGAGVVGLCLAGAGIVGFPQHSDLVARASAFYVVTDSGERLISRDVFDDIMYARYVLGLLGPAMAVSSFLFLIYRAFLLLARRPGLLKLDGTFTAPKRTAS
jgi:hypothetical protein